LGVIRGDKRQKKGHTGGKREMEEKGEGKAIGPGRIAQEKSGREGARTCKKVQKQKNRQKYVLGDFRHAGA